MLALLISWAGCLHCMMKSFRVFLVLDGARARARGGQIRFRASHPFCSCGFFARMMPHRLFTSPPISANMRVAVCIRNSRCKCSVPTESTVKEFPFDFYSRPENDLSVTTVSANLGGQVSTRERCPSFHAILTQKPVTKQQPFSPTLLRHGPSWRRESLVKKLGAGKTLWATAPSFGQKLHSLHLHHTQGSQSQRGSSTQEFAFDTSRSTVRCRPRYSLMGDACPPTRSRSCVHSFDPYLRRVEVSFRRLTSLHTLTEHRSTIHRCCSFRHWQFDTGPRMNLVHQAHVNHGSH